MLSVCMATYNGERYIKEQLDSIIQQLGPNDEIVIQDDGSKDATISIIESYSDSRIKLEANKINLGVIPTFEICISRAQKEIIFLADQDDIWHPNKIEVTISNFSNKSVMAVVSNAVIVDQDGTIIHDSYFSLSNGGSGVLRNFLRNSYLGCCLAFRRELLPIIRPVPKVVRTHDGWIGMVSNLCGEVVFIQEPLIDYRRHGKNASQMHRFPLYDVIYRRFALLYNIVRISGKIMRFRNPSRLKKLS